MLVSTNALVADKYQHSGTFHMVFYLCLILDIIHKNMQLDSVTDMPYIRMSV